MEKMVTQKKVKLKNGKEITVKSLTFETYVEFLGLITDTFAQLATGLGIGKFFKNFIPIISKMTNLSEEEIKNLSGADGMKLFRVCIEVIKEDEDFLQELKETLNSVKQIIPSQSTL